MHAGEERLRALLAEAESDEEILAVYVFGSRGRPDGRADERSDYDVAVILRDGADVDAFDRRWPYVHGAPLEVARGTLSELRADHGPVYEAVDLRLDKTGEVAALLAAKRQLPAELRAKLVRESLDAYVNSTYRSLRYGEVGGAEGARLDAAESLAPLLTAVFALHGRPRPFNKYVAPSLPAPFAVERLLRVLEGDVGEQRVLFRDVEQLAREHGFGDVIDEWEPDVAWLRGEAGYRR